MTLRDVIFQSYGRQGWDGKGSFFHVTVAKDAKVDNEEGLGGGLSGLRER
jgi:hypothetical protein